MSVINNGVRHMTRTYEFRAVVLIKVEADSATEALETAEGIAEEINAELPTGATFIHKDGHVYVAAE
jgi:hypothetical protein